MLSRTEQFCKWTLLGLLLLSVIYPIWAVANYGLIYTTDSIEAILVLVLIATTIEGIIGIAAWFMIHRENETGKKILFGLYGTTLGLHCVILLFLIVIPLFAGPIFYSGEYYAAIALLSLSAAVLALEHYWTKYLF